MRYIIEAACICHTGKLRKNNEDNFYFDDKCLELQHGSLPHPVLLEQGLRNGLCFAVFDGMGGANFGELASFAAARQMQQTQRSFHDFFIPERQYLRRLSQKLNEAVARAQEEMKTDKMGTTMVSLYFSGRYVYVCNVGDSRAYRLREGEFMQLSRDHIIPRSDGQQKKAPLSQYLGFGDEEMQISPHIAKGAIQENDMYLICSDGVTDMLTNFEIADIMLRSENTQACAEGILQAALDRGGRDNITAIVCQLNEREAIWH